MWYEHRVGEGDKIWNLKFEKEFWEKMYDKEGFEVYWLIFRGLREIS